MRRRRRRRRQRRRCWCWWGKTENKLKLLANVPVAAVLLPPSFTFTMYQALSYSLERSLSGVNGGWGGGIVTTR
eukprot:764686-Hanusia_phi.AAC.1